MGGRDGVGTGAVGVTVGSAQGMNWSSQHRFSLKHSRQDLPFLKILWVL